MKIITYENDLRNAGCSKGARLSSFLLSTPPTNKTEDFSSCITGANAKTLRQRHEK